MGWVRFTADFDWSPPELNGAVTLAFKAGTTALVRKVCERAAIDAHKATITTRRAERGEDSGR